VCVSVMVKPRPLGDVVPWETKEGSRYDLVSTRAPIQWMAGIPIGSKGAVNM